MDTKTRTYFKILFFGIVIFAIAKYFTDKSVNKSNRANIMIALEINSQEKTLTNKITEDKIINKINQNGLELGNNWRSR